MKMFYYRGRHPNFGDELNHWLWPKLLPDFFDEDASTLFVGIGSTIGDAATHAGKKLVFGAGFVPHYHPLPQINEAWNIYFVRGLRTAARLGLEPTKAITDAGALIRTVVPVREPVGTQVSYMPHWQSLEHGQWQAACDHAGIRLIDPRAPVEQVLAQIQDSSLMIAEAMHGAIIADALRVPWVPVVPLNPVHRDKWYDWAESLGLSLDIQRMLPSVIEEVTAASFHGRVPPIGNGGVGAGGGKGMASRAKEWLNASSAAPWVNRRLAEMAGRRLRQLAKQPGQLSDVASITRATERMQEKLAQLRKDYA